MVCATKFFTAFSSLTSNFALATELGPWRPAISSASSRPSAISAIITRAPSAASACEYAGDALGASRNMVFPASLGMILLHLTCCARRGIHVLDRHLGVNGRTLVSGRTGPAMTGN
jgi:hypothetical protein